MGVYGIASEEDTIIGAEAIANPLPNLHQTIRKMD